MEIDVCPRWLLARLGIPADAQPHAGVLISSMIALFSPFLLMVLPHFCLMQRFFHIPCPGCGVLHAMASLVRLHFVQAWRSNPAGVVFGCMLCFQIVARPLAIASARTRPVIHQLSQRGSYAVLACLMAVWVLRLVSGGFHLGISSLSQLR